MGNATRRYTGPSPFAPVEFLDPSDLPDRFASVDALDEFMTRPSREGPAARVRTIWPTGMTMPPPMP